MIWRYARVAFLLAAAWAVYKLVTTVAGCFRDPWATYPMATQPDISCRTGTVHGWTVWIWKCVDGERVAIGQYSAEMMWRSPRKDTAPCGTVTALEQEVGLPDRVGCRPSGGWNGAAYASPIVLRYKRTTPLAGSADDAQVRSEDYDTMRTVERELERLNAYAEVDGFYNGVFTVELSPSTSPDEVAAIDRAITGIDELVRVDGR